METKKAIKVRKSKNVKTVEASAEPQKPFSKKRIIVLIVFGVLAIVIIALTFKFILDINWISLFSSISNGFAQKIGILWFALLLFYLVHCIFRNFVSTWLRLRSLGYKISAGQYWLLGLGTAFFSAVTPPIISDTFTLVWMKSNGVPTYRVSSIIFSNTLFWQVIQILVTLPSFIIVLANYQKLIVNSEGVTVLVLLIAGLIIDIISASFVFLLCWSKKIHYSLSRVFNWFKKKLHMKYHTKEETAKKYQENAVIKQDFISYMKDWKTTTIINVLLVFTEIITYISFDFSMYFVQNIHWNNAIYYVGFDFAWAFNCTNVAFTANRLNFLVPGGEGSLEFILQTFVKNLSSWQISPKTAPSNANNIIKTFIGNSIAVWRLFGAIIPAFAGLIGVGVWAINKGVNVKHGKKFIAEEK